MKGGGFKIVIGMNLGGYYLLTLKYISGIYYTGLSNK